MAWQETRVMELRMMFICDFLSGGYNMAELCEAYKISRKTGYKWLDRYNEGGPGGLVDRSRAPAVHPQAVSAEIKSVVLDIKGRFTHWGARKIDWQLRKEHPDWRHYPAKSTIGLMLRHEGLSVRRRRIRTASPTHVPLTNGLWPNDVWCADFKGHFATGDGNRCNPLTISDHATRYLLCCRHVDTTGYCAVKQQFARVFREYGLPVVMRTDNGLPFSSCGVAGISSLSAWWIRLGIYPERIEPGKPQQNGRHERMHRTLKQDTAMPAANTIRLQQKRFDEFTEYYNDKRPHEALDMKTPSQLYTCCDHKFPARLPIIEYADSLIVRKVATHGQVFMGGRALFVSECLCGEYIGFERIEEDKSRMWYCNYELGILDHKNWRIEQVKPHPLFAGVNPCPSHNSIKVLPMSSVQSVT
jgi:transposase InsO family protein